MLYNYAQRDVRKLRETTAYCMFQTETVLQKETFINVYLIAKLYYSLFWINCFIVCMSLYVLFVLKTPICIY